MISRIFQYRNMSPEYFNLILFYILTTSCIIIVSGLNVEGVSSEDEPNEDKVRQKRAKNPSENTQNSAKNFDKTGVGKERQNGSSSSFTKKSMEELTYTTAELALITVLENACNDLKIGDLMNAGSVCRSWNKIAERESSNRGLERALLPSIYSSEISNATSDFHVYNVLNSKPNVAILFMAPIGRRRSEYHDLDKRTIAVYRKFFPQHLVTIGVDVSMMDENIILSCPAFLLPSNGILGLFMPLHRDAQTKVSSCFMLTRSDFSRCATQIISDLRLDSHEKESTIILLGNNVDGLPQVVNLIKSNFIQKSYSLWGGVFQHPIIHSKTQDDISGLSSIFALNLSGSNIKSSSIFFDSAIEDDEISKKLLKLKNSLILQRQTIGLICGPEIVERLQTDLTRLKLTTNKKLMDLVKQIFPNIPFIGIFNYYNNIQIGVDSLSDDNNQLLIARNFLSLMIITYN